VGPTRQHIIFCIWEADLRVRVPYLRLTCASAYHI